MNVTKQNMSKKADKEPMLVTTEEVLGITAAVRAGRYFALLGLVQLPGQLSISGIAGI